MTSDKKHPVIEIFGPTIQGEGALAGTVSHFVRMGGCDFRCAWCDSDHAVLPEKVRANAEKLDDVEIWERVRALPSADWVTISGGNPAMHRIDRLVELLGLDYKVAVETQGTLWKDWLANVDMLTVSPKPPASTMAEKSLQLLPGFMKNALAAEHGPDTMCLKIPVHDEGDLSFLEAMHSRYSYIPMYVSVVTEMGGLYGTFANGHVDTQAELIERWRWVTERLLREPDRFPNIRIIPQMHALLWGHDRGH